MRALQSQPFTSPATLAWNHPHSKPSPPPSSCPSPKTHPDHPWPQGLLKQMVFAHNCTNCTDSPSFASSSDLFSGTACPLSTAMGDRSPWQTHALSPAQGKATAPGGIHPLTQNKSFPTTAHFFSKAPWYQPMIKLLKLKRLKEIFGIIFSPPLCLTVVNFVSCACSLHCSLPLTPKAAECDLRLQEMGAAWKKLEVNTGSSKSQVQI